MNDDSRIFRTVIVDDEEDGRSVIKSIIQNNIDNIEIVGEADSVQSSIKLLENTKPDIVFLDIGLSDGTGFDILEHFSEIPFEIIFQTAYNQFAIRAIKFSALDYLLKPINVSELIKAVEKACQKCSLKVYNNSQINFVKEQIKKSKPSKIALPTDAGFVFIHISDVVRCLAESNYTKFFMVNKSEILTCHTLGEYEELLMDYDFFRVHKSHLINLNYVKSYTKGKGGFVNMTDGSEIELSQRKKEEFLQRFAKL